MTIKWNVVDKTHYLREYEAKINNIEFYIWHSSDAGFGITAHRINPDGSKDSLHTRFGIIWMRTLKRCKAHAENILAHASAS